MAELPAARLAEIKALKPAPGTDPTCWVALQDLLADHQHLTEAAAETAEELAQWTGALR